MNIEIRKIIAKAALKGKASHIGSALSVVEILEALYFQVANVSARNCNDAGRDRIILSKGHGSLALYAVLALKGIMPMEYLDSYMIDGGCLPCHVDMTCANGLEASTGSLGHGPGIAEGIALANRLKKISARVYVIIGDGEFQEGSVHEALNSIGFLSLHEITVILDNNGFQSVDATENVANSDRYADIFASWGFTTAIVDGHDTSALVLALKKEANKPKAIIANTTKGKGFSCMENTLTSHYTKLDTAMYDRIIKELG